MACFSFSHFCHLVCDMFGIWYFIFVDIVNMICIWHLTAFNNLSIALLVIASHCCVFHDISKTHVWPSESMFYPHKYQYCCWQLSMLRHFGTVKDCQSNFWQLRVPMYFFFQFAICFSLFVFAGGFWTKEPGFGGPRNQAPEDSLRNPGRKFPDTSHPLLWDQARTPKA